MTFLFLLLAALCLPGFAWAFPPWSEWGLLFLAVPGLIVVASLVMEHWALEFRLRSCGAGACGISPDQGSYPCPLCWHVDS